MTLFRRMRRLRTRVRRAWSAEVRARARRRPLWTDTVLYESFGGNGALDNPEAIFRRLLDRPDAAGLLHVWALRRGHRSFRREFRRHPRVRIVRYGSDAYHRALSRAGYLVNNATFPSDWGKRPGQTYLNTWHGTPLKHMGYDMPAGALASANVLRNFLAADLLLSQSPWMTERMYLDAYRLASILPGRILEVGYPRVDRQALTPAEVARVRADLGVGDRALVVWAPTWTGDDFSRPRDQADEQLAVVRRLQERLGDGYAVRFKAHQSVHALVGAHPDAAGVLISNDIPTNVILGATDHLVTDFSSIFFDFLALDRPMSFFVPPGGDYRADRGAYVDERDLPGPTLATADDLARRIAGRRDLYVERRHEWAARFTPDADRRAADRVIDALLHPDPAASAPGPGHDAGARTSVLVYLGGMRSNGITSSALNLLAALDHDDWDVTALLARPRGAARENQLRIPPRVRQVFRIGGMNGSKLELFRLLRHGHRAAAPEDAGEARLWTDEWRRLLGDARFDVVVDFSGYSRFWTELVLHAPSARRVLWLHNDMAAEVHRTGAGTRPIHRSLPAVLETLPRFDALVSVSPRLSALNARNLAGRYGVPESRFVSAANLIDARRVLASAAVPPESLPEFAPSPAQVDAPAQDRPPRWLDDLTRPGLVWFVTVGRLSPEKNQGRLIDAFAVVHRRHPTARLLLIGDGPCRERLSSKVAASGLAGAVVFAGQVGNPFPLVAAADVFVLSSDYEGQPMVLLEAAVLGLPVVTTGFASAGDALPAGCAAIVDLSVEGLAEGMSARIGSPTSVTSFDAEEHNRRALAGIESALRGPARAAPIPQARFGSVSRWW